MWGALACAAILGALCLAPRADAAWSPPTMVAQQHDVDAPVVAMDPAGDAVFLWKGNNDVIYTRTRSADGTFSPIEAIARSLIGGYDVAVDSHGNAYYVWMVPGDKGERARARVRYADGTWSPAQGIASVPDRGEGIESPTVGVGASGRAVFGWVSARLVDGSVLENNLVQTRSRSASGQLSPVRTVVRDERVFDMGVDALGNATFVWDKYANGGRAEFRRVLAADGDLGAVKQISQVGSKHGFPTGFPLVAVTPDGRAIFEWAKYNADTDNITLMSRARAGDGDFQPLQVLASLGGDTANMRFELGVGPRGDAAFCWTPDANGAVYARTRATDGALGPVKTIAPAMTFACQPVIDSQGNVAFVWDAQQGGKNRIFARSEDAAGQLGPTQALSPAGFNAYFQDVAMSPGGDAAVAWREGGNRGFAIQAAFEP